MNSSIAEHIIGTCFMGGFIKALNNIYNNGDTNEEHLPNESPKKSFIKNSLNSTMIDSKVSFSNISSLKSTINVG